jgi:hypothetical protein
MKVKLNIRGLSIPERIARGREIVKAMDKNPAFPNPQPTLAEVTADIDALDAAYAHSQAVKQEAIASTTATHDKDAAYEITMRKLGAHVESVATDEKTVQSAGMSVGSTRGPLVPATVPTGLTASEGDHDGTLDLNHDRVKGAKSYVYEMSLDPPTATSWKHAAVSAKSSVTISGLASGTRYWFRVAAITSTGQSGWSDPATKIAP